MSMPVVSSHRSGRTLSARRLAWLAAGAMAAAPGGLSAQQMTPAPPAPVQSPPAPSTPALPSGPQSFAAVVRTVKPAVISVRVKVTETVPEGLSSPDRERNERDEKRPPFFHRPPFDSFFRDFGIPNFPDGRGRPHLALAQGSGFFISSDGYAVTNSHVVSDGSSVEVQTDDDKTYKARVVGTDTKTDLALLKIDGRNDFPYVGFAEGVTPAGERARPDLRLYHRVYRHRLDSCRHVGRVRQGWPRPPRDRHRCICYAETDQGAGARDRAQPSEAG